MESKTGYNLLVPESSGILLSITSSALIFFGVVILALLTYNPVAASFAVSLGILLSVSGAIIYVHLKKNPWVGTIPNPWAAAVLIPLIQITACIAYYYNPMNHGPVTIILSMGVFPSYIFTNKTHALRYLPLVAVLVGLGLTVYYSNVLWLDHSLFWAVVSSVLVACVMMLNRVQVSMNRVGVIGLGNFVVNTLFVLGLMVLGIRPLSDELSLISLCVLSGVLIGLGAILGAVSRAGDINCIGYSLIGILQMLVDLAIFSVNPIGQLFLPTLPIFIGVEALLIVSLWKKRKVSD